MSAADKGLAGTPSDAAPEILATGHGGITTLFVSMAERHPEGADADYLRWHTLDHRPEQQRLASLRASLRAVSTAACRAARAAGDERFDAIDHVMTYFFADIAGLAAFNELSIALRDAGRAPFVLAPVQRGVYTVQARAAAPRVKVGADVLPWFPARGLYLIIEQGPIVEQGLIVKKDAAAPAALTEVRGVAGVWCGSAATSAFSTAAAGQSITYCFLDDDPVETAERLRPVLEQRWRTTGVRPLFAAPFHAVVAHAWDRYLP